VLIEEETRHPPLRIILAGIPLFFCAVAISVFTHLSVHLIADAYFCPGGPAKTAFATYGDAHSLCALSSFAAVMWTFLLALGSFAYYIHHPSNLFAGLMAFTNTSLQLPDTLTVFWQLFFLKKDVMAADESLSLALLGLADTTIGVALLCFFSLATLFLNVTTVHDTKTVSWKWALALILFAALFPLKNIFAELFSTLSMRLL
jgi:hypothetical protein